MSPGPVRARAGTQPVVRGLAVGEPSALAEPGTAVVSASRDERHRPLERAEVIERVGGSGTGLRRIVGTASAVAERLREQLLVRLADRVDGAVDDVDGDLRGREDALVDLVEVPVGVLEHLDEGRPVLLAGGRDDLVEAVVVSRDLQVNLPPP